MTSYQRELLANHPMFEHLAANQLDQLYELSVFQTHPKNACLFMPGERADTVYILLGGSVKTGAFSHDGKEIIKHILYPAAVFGELGLVGEELRRDYAITLEKATQVLAIPLASFRRFVHSDYVLTMKVMNAIGARLRTSESRLESLVFKDARARIVDFLKEAAQKRGRRVGLETLIRSNFTQQDIANFTGTSRQTVTTVLNELRNTNLIYFTRSKILIRDLSNLA